jgi:hypothetical protein
MRKTLEAYGFLADGKYSPRPALDEPYSVGDEGPAPYGSLSETYSVGDEGPAPYGSLSAGQPSLSMLPREPDGVRW